MRTILAVPIFLRWSSTILFSLAVVGLSITPGTALPDDHLFAWLYATTSTPIQKVMHVAIYAVLTSLWMWTLAGLESLRTRSCLSVFLALGLGIALEWCQASIPGRYGTLEDVVLNGLGVIAGLVTAIFLLDLRPKYRLKA